MSVNIPPCLSKKLAVLLNNILMGFASKGKANGGASLCVDQQLCQEKGSRVELSQGSLSDQHVRSDSIEIFKSLFDQPRSANVKKVSAAGDRSF